MRGQVKKLSFGEELGNTLSHGVMMVAMLVLLPITAIYNYVNFGWASATTVSIFIIAIFLMFMASTLYHMSEHGRTHKTVLRIIDHCFIYVAIAGTYTPIALNVIGGWQGWVIFGIQWAFVLIGVLYKSMSQKGLPWLSLTVYLVMGWSVLIFFPIFIKSATTPLFWLIFSGGIAYSVGAYFYSKDKAYFHMIWHIFIGIGAICHVLAIGFFLK